MVNEVKYKYQKQIDELQAVGCQLPTLFAPNNLHACRFAISLLSLSCFTTAEKADTFYKNLRKAFKNVQNSVGDSLSEGCLTNDDGRRTSAGTNGHFDFYEYETCDLNKTFQITKRLMEEKKDEEN